MKYKYRYDNDQYDLMLSEQDQSGLAVYSRQLDNGEFLYVLRSPLDMAAIEE